MIGIVEYFSGLNVTCAHCGIAMVTSLKTLADAEEPYLQAWCITDDCDQKDQVIEITPSRIGFKSQVKQEVIQ